MGWTAVATASQVSTAPSPPAAALACTAKAQAVRACTVRAPAAMACTASPVVVTARQAYMVNLRARTVEALSALPLVELKLRACAAKAALVQAYTVTAPAAA